MEQTQFLEKNIFKGYKNLNEASDKKENPHFSERDFESILEIKKYIDRRPRIASMFEVKTIKGSAVIASIAGILSRAKRISVSSIIIKAINRGVARRFPSICIKKLAPSVSVVTGKTFFIFLKIKESFGSKSVSSDLNILNAVNSRKAPKT